MIKTKTRSSNREFSWVNIIFVSVSLATFMILFESFIPALNKPAEFLLCKNDEKLFFRKLGTGRKAITHAYCSLGPRFLESNGQKYNLGLHPDSRRVTLYYYLTMILVYTIPFFVLLGALKITGKNL